MTLFMTFKDWNERSYLSSLDIARNQQEQTQMLQVEDSLIVCRDHFGIRGLYGSSQEVRDRGPGLFFHTIPLRAQGRKSAKPRGFFDGRFLRTLNAERAAFRPVIEWNMASLPSNMAFRVSSTALLPDLGSLCRYICHEFKDISGISAAVQGCRTVGLFCHTKGDSRGLFGSFVKQMQALFVSSMLVFPYFSINDQEQLHTIGVRWVKDSRFPVSDPVIQVATNQGRAYTFGPQPQDEQLFEYQALRPVGEGSIVGLFYRSADEVARAISNIGIFASTSCDRLDGLNLNVSPNRSIRCPRRGSSIQDWFFSKARIEPDTILQVCMADSTCLGAILTYPDNRRECLGEFRFDKSLSDQVELQNCSFTNMVTDRRLYVLIRRLPKDSVVDTSTDWNSFPTTGTLVLWYGPHGHWLQVLDELQ